MEKIKLRVWDKKNKEMIYLENQAETQYNFEICAFDGNLYYYDRVKGLPGDNYVLMLYVGMDDKNGREIYEGDIVEFENSSVGFKYKSVGIVKFEKGAYYVFFHQDQRLLRKCSDIKVIGNKYKTPELLRGK